MNIEKEILRYQIKGFMLIESQFNKKFDQKSVWFEHYSNSDEYNDVLYDRTYASSLDIKTAIKRAIGNLKKHGY